MKRFNFLLPVCLFAIAFSFAMNARAGSKAATTSSAIKSSDFAGKWQGNEQCTVVGAPVAIVVITTDGPTQVYLTGIYSIQGKVRGVIKGSTVIIPRQVVEDPNFKNLEIEGSLTLGNSHNTLTGIFAVLNNGSRDGCTVNYRK